MHSTHQHPPHNPHPHGCRVSTPELRQSLKQAEYFEGLDHDVKRYDLLVLVKRVGKSAGYTPRLIQLLDYYMAFTRDCDWQEGNNPIVYQSLAKTAMDLDITERQLQRMEHRLFELGVLTWCDSGNHRRYGQRDPETGELLYAFGVDLTPLAALRGTLQSLLAKKTAETEHWRKTKRQVSWYRAQIRSMLVSVIEEQGNSSELIALQSRYETISGVLRSSMSISTLTSLLDAHKSLHSELLPLFKDPVSIGMTSKMSSRGDKNVVHIQYLKQQQLNELNCSPPDNGLQGEEKKSGAERSEPKSELSGESMILKTGLQHITLKQTLNAASERFRSYIPLERRAMSWEDIIEAAYRLRRSLRVSGQSWSRACEELGRTGAAICLLITDQAAQRENDPIRHTGAYFNAMIKRAKAGELKLHASIFALLKREDV